MNGIVLTGIAMRPDYSYVLTFESEPGHVYRIEFKHDLNELDWHPLGTNQFATGATLAFSDCPSAPQRFYRVVLVE